MSPTWQIYVYFLQTITLTPIYTIILLDFVVSQRKFRPFKGPYYRLMVSQGIADISAVTVYCSLLIARYYSIGNEFIYSLSPQSPIFYANSGPFLFVIRIVGVFLITLQRYLTVCRPHGVMNYHLHHCPPLLLALIHWSLGLLIYLPALLNSDAYFENSTSLFLMTSAQHAHAFSITVALSFITLGLTIIVMYSRIAVTMCVARKLSSNGKKPSRRSQDVRLTLHVFILILFCVICFAFHLGEYILACDEDRTNLKAFRLFYPTVSGNFSFINPIMLLALNRDVQKRIRCVFGREKKGSSSISVLNNRKSTV